ncbi:MAG TPA: RNB domain-containing ribonuclease [Solirubrobacterales bacterium]|nr:RNB domain-containing ribonuclease [Solirubrobacterales bacterium]
MPGRGRGRRDRSRAEAPRRRSRSGGMARSERRAREREAQRPARETVEELLREELGYRGFRPTIEGEAREAAKWAERESGPRRDLTALATFTVDPATARDFDDAISAQREGSGARVWIHIADVAAHVKPGSLLDQEARRRANSTYVPGAVEPMLPHALSSEACSLAPGVERLAVTTEVELGPGMEPRRARFYRSRIRSDTRLNYDQLDEIFAGRRQPPAEVAEPLAAAREVAAGLGEHRGATSLDVESSEPEFEFDTDGNVVRAHGVTQTEAHRLIERLMILNNEQVAQLLERERVPAIYRVHAQPDAARIERLLEQLAALGVPTPPLRRGLAPSEAGQVAAEASRLARQEAGRRGHGREAYTSLVLRSLKQASYSERNAGHAGLGSAAYCHFTSPIRRYPDLVCHRALLALLGEGEEAPTLAQARDAAAEASARERESAQIERQADDVCAAYLLERELGERGLDAVFEGEVSGVIRSAAFVAFRGELGDVYEGMLPARRLPGEYYKLDEAEVALVGRESGKRVRLGDPISVRVAGVDAARGRAELDLAAEESEGPE